MAEQSRAQQTEKPTPRRIRKAREAGQIARSQDVGHAVSLAVFVGWTLIGGAAFMTRATSMLQDALRHAGQPTEGAVLTALDASFGQGLALVGPPLIALLFVATLVALLMSGFSLTKPLIKLDFARLNPVQGLQRLVTVERLVGAVKALLRLGMYAAIALAVVVPEWSRVLSFASATIGEIFQQSSAIVLRMLIRALVFGVILAGFDYGLARYRWHRSLYMTKQEIKDEHKENEGNPQVKRRMRQRALELTRKRMMSAVRTADVVLTNPTHVAVALKYERGAMAAPVVVAKGRDLVAERIKAEAREHDVPIVEDPPLARLLERVCKLDHPIPETLYRAVAEVFAYVFGKRKSLYRVHDEVADLVVPPPRAARRAARAETRP